MLTAEQIAVIAAKALEDKKARDVKVLKTTRRWGSWSKAASCETARRRCCEGSSPAAGSSCMWGGARLPR